jgi:prepilin-type N-terminal cleavage/methylation domain-containing protein
MGTAGVELEPRRAEQAMPCSEKPHRQVHATSAACCTGSPSWHRHNRRGPAGFSLVELLAVVAVTAVVGGVAISAYHTYAVRAQIADGIAHTQPARDRAAASFRATGVPPRDRLAAGIGPGHDPAWGDYVADIDVVNGRIDIRFGGAADDAIAGRTLSITPFETIDQSVVWVCGNKVPGVGLEPLGFAGGAPQPVQVLSPIDARYLPPSCR